MSCNWNRRVTVLVTRPLIKTIQPPTAGKYIKPEKDCEQTCDAGLVEDEKYVLDKWAELCNHLQLVLFVEVIFLRREKVLDKKHWALLRVVDPS